MSEPSHTDDRAQESGPWPFDDLVRGDDSAQLDASGFTTAFRGYDRVEVDAAITDLTKRLRAYSDEHAALEARQRQAQDAAAAEHREQIARLEADLAAAEAQAAVAEQQVTALAGELGGASGGTADNQRFEEILRVAEDQASLLIKNASVQADRLLEAAREEVRLRRQDADTDAEAIATQAQHDAQQVRLRIDTELTAHEATLGRERAHAAEKVAQAEQEAAAIRTEAEKGAAALRAMVARETAQDRADADAAVREMRARVLEFEESLTRRQDDAQQEFLVLHNQAVAHAERITTDANEQVAASLDHAQRISAKAEDFERLMRAQAEQIESDAALRAREHLERSRQKAQRIIDMVGAHSLSVLRDAEDRTRQLRWQQHELTSFMSEVKELIRPEAPAMAPATAPAADGASDGAETDENPTVTLDAADSASLTEE
ncbi:MAG: DivIVA domain-containing protein [Actinobacteria bacterium]|nr:DivIVA domain-containing protein [Actinomycetota bacterium]